MGDGPANWRSRERRLGGSQGAAGPTVAGGMIFAGAGYPGVQNGVNGNVLLAFGVE
ncbi:MAG TPA: hypothetical protein VER98_04725 [Terriglobia bacterium]|nr:hypothetical protein [Terriglobia bacterium]